MGGKSSSAVRYPWLTRRSSQIDFLPGAVTCCFCAKHLFVAPMTAWVHPAAGNRQIKYDGGEVRAAVDVGTSVQPIRLFFGSGPSSAT